MTQPPLTVTLWLPGLPDVYVAEPPGPTPHPGFRPMPVSGNGVLSALAVKV